MNICLYKCVSPVPLMLSLIFNWWLEFRMNSRLEKIGNLKSVSRDRLILNFLNSTLNQLNSHAVGRGSGFSSWVMKFQNFNLRFSALLFNSSFETKIWVVCVNKVIVKRSLKFFGNSFLKNSILEFLSKAPIVAILTYFLKAN